MKEDNISSVFPFGQTEHIGNYKLWRGKYKVKTTSGPAEIDCVYLSDLSGEWSVRIPETYEMYGIIIQSFVDSRSDDELKRREGMMVLTTVAANIMYASVVGNGYFQRGINMLATVYANPSLLDAESDGHAAFVDDVQAVISEFLEWRKGYDARMKAMEPDDEQMHQDDVADQAAEILSEE